MAGMTADQLRGLFAQEAEGRLVELGQLLFQLEQTGGDEKILRSIFREFHTIKGSAAVTGLTEVSRIAHDLEELVDTFRVGGQLVTAEVIETLRVGTGQLSHAISAAQDTGRQLAASPAVPAASGAVSPINPPPPTPSTEGWAELSRLVGETAATHERLGRALKEQFNIDPATSAEFEEQSGLLNELQDWAMRAQRIPISTVIDRLQRAVSDLARAQGKHVRWQAHGTDTELDRGVLHQLSDSLRQLVRNAVDHGIELPEERVRAGKRAEGTVRLRAMRLDSNVVISVTDDGRGIDVQSLSRQAERRGVETNAMSAEELLGLTFEPGLSTTLFVTDVSGRGVGLNRVRTTVEAIHGRVEVQSHPGAGTEFRLIVPIHPPALRQQRILVVDDALTIRELQRAILVRAGFAVRVATDGVDALVRLAEAPSDLVLTDLQMPNMGGYALTEAIRADRTLAHIPVLILSSSSTEEDRQRGLDAGASGYLEKGGFDEASLLSAVSRLLGANS